MHTAKKESQTTMEPLRLLKLHEVSRKTRKSRSEIYRCIARGTFPAPIKLGERAIVFLASEVDVWISERIAERDGKGGTT